MTFFGKALHILYIHISPYSQRCLQSKVPVPQVFILQPINAPFTQAIKGSLRIPTGRISRVSQLESLEFYVELWPLCMNE